MGDDLLTIGKHAFSSRLIVGTGKYKDVDETSRAIAASGAELVTVALRRVNLQERGEGSMMSLLTGGKFKLLPNTAGCATAEEAVRTCRLARELGLSDLVKLEVIGTIKRSFDNEQTLAAAKVLVAEVSRFSRIASTTPSCAASRRSGRGGERSPPPSAPDSAFVTRTIWRSFSAPSSRHRRCRRGWPACGGGRELGCHGVSNTAIAGAKTRSDGRGDARRSSRAAKPFWPRIARRGRAAASSPESGSSDERRETSRARFLAGALAYAVPVRQGAGAIGARRNAGRSASMVAQKMKADGDDQGY
jgi:thiazole synthase